MMYETLIKPKGNVKRNVVQCQMLSSAALAAAGIGGSAAHHTQAHHKIPNEIFEEAVGVFQPLIIQRIGEFDSAWNGISLPVSDSPHGVYFAHNGAHNQYTTAVRAGLIGTLGAGGLANVFTVPGFAATQAYVAANLSNNHFKKLASGGVAGIPSGNVNGNNKLV